MIRCTVARHTAFTFTWRVGLVVALLVLVSSCGGGGGGSGPASSTGDQPPTGDQSSTSSVSMTIDPAIPLSATASVVQVRSPIDSQPLGTALTVPLLVDGESLLLAVDAQENIVL